MSTHLRAWATAVALAAAPLPALARDTNVEGIPVGHRATGLGGAYTAVGGDGVSLWYNPAGLGSLAEKGISANVTVYQWRKQEIGTFARFGDAEALGGIEVEGTGNAESSDFSTVPSSLVFALPLGDPEGATRHGIAGGLFIPDADSYVMKSSRSLQAGGSTFAQLKARDIRDERSYWAGVGYGYDTGRWAFGVSAFAIAHLYQRSTIVSAYVNTTNVQGATQPVYLSIVETGEVETTDVSAALLAGALYRPTETLTLGLTVRSPSLGPFYSQGEALFIRAGQEFVQGQQTSVVDRLETDELEAKDIQPLRVNAGLAWRPSRGFLLSGDVHFTAGSLDEQVLDGPLLCPPDAAGRPQTCTADTRSLDPDVEHDRQPVVNVAVGSEIGLNEKWLLRLGAYTDFSAVDEKDLDPTDPLDARVDIYSGVLGVGYLGERGSTDIGLLFRWGEGETRSQFNEGGGTPKFTVTQIGLYLAGSADI